MLIEKNIATRTGIVFEFQFGNESTVATQPSREHTPPPPPADPTKQDPTQQTQHTMANPARGARGAGMLVWPTMVPGPRYAVSGLRNCRHWGALALTLLAVQSATPTERVHVVVSSPTATQSWNTFLKGFNSRFNT